MDTLRKEEIRRTVRKTYGKVAETGQACCSGCDCLSENTSSSVAVSNAIGYSAEELASAPEGANMGLGCGNPQAIADLRRGETVLDLGSGGGFDCFLAAKAVGDEGRVIGVDMTPEMLSKARQNAAKAEAGNVEFRLGEIEHLPVADNEVDAIISNCVINLSPEKDKVFAEAFRALKKGGRLAITDIVATGPVPDKVRGNLEMIAGCVAGATPVNELEATLKQAGFADISVQTIAGSSEMIDRLMPSGDLAGVLASARIQAVKP